MWDSENREWRMAWDMYFCSILGLQYHPANPPEQRMELDEIGRIVDSAMEVRRKFFTQGE